MILPVVSPNFTQFGFSATFDIYNRAIIFDLTNLTVFTIGGAAHVQGIGFRVQDEDGTVLCDYNYANQIPTPATLQKWTLDLSAMGFAFLYQRYLVSAAIKDQNGTITVLSMPVKAVSIPMGVNESGYVNANFQISPDCINNALLVKDLTPYVYQGVLPITNVKAGTLNYPTGTIAAIPFTATPFQNNTVYTGQMSITCKSVASYYLEDGFSVLVTYKANNSIFDIVCADKVSDILCCIREVQQEAILNCGNAKGDAASQKLQAITIPFLAALTAEMSGKDPSIEVDLIKKTLDCGCDCGGVKQNEATPFNPATSTYSIVFAGVGGTTIPAPTTYGTTKTYAIQSNTYSVTKGVPADLSFTIGLDNSVPNTTKYPITFNYDILSATILNSIGLNPTNKTLLNSLITFATQVNSDWNASTGVTQILNKPVIPAAQVSADWNATTGPAVILNKPTITFTQANADFLATSGPTQILNKPTIPAAQVSADWVATTGVTQILNKPVIPAAQVSSDWNASTGIAAILNKPAVPAAQVNVDWLSTGGITQIANKPILATVATTGAYSDLTGQPTIPAPQVSADWNSVTGVTQILNKPSIGAAQVNSDWTASSGVAQILNKPTIPAVQTAGNGITITANNAQLGGTLTQSTTIDATSHQLSITDNPTVVIGASAPVTAEMLSVQATSANVKPYAGYVQNQYNSFAGTPSAGLGATILLNPSTDITDTYVNGVRSGAYDSFIIAGTGNIALNSNVKNGYFGIYGLTLKGGSGNVTGNTIGGGIFGAFMSDTGNVSAMAAVKIIGPSNFTPSTAYTGTIAEYDGLRIEDIGASDYASKVTNKFAIYQLGVGDVSRFFGPVQNAGGTVNFTSDERVKENIVDFSRGLAELNQIKTHKFNFTYNKSQEVTGVIAQELETVIPEAVTKGNFSTPDGKTSFDDFRMVDQSVLFYTMLNAIKELSAKITDLETKVTALTPKTV